MIFYYHMHGPDVGSLKLSVRPQDMEGEEKVLWEQRGDQGNTWHRVYQIVENETQHGLYNLILQGSLAGKGGGDIAIDDVVFTYNCKLEHGDTTTPPPTSSPEDFINCDFQDDLCNWHLDEELNVTDRFHFERRNGDENLGALMRPDSDHNGDRKSKQNQIKRVSLLNYLSFRILSLG